MEKKMRVFVRCVPADEQGAKVGSEAVFIHNEFLASVFQGNKTSPKVSDIRFEDGPQEWVAMLRDGREIFRHKNRDTVVAGEAGVINEMFARGEYIPGGFMGEPHNKLPECIKIPLEKQYKFLGRMGECDLYAFIGYGPVFFVKPAPGGRFHIVRNKLGLSDPVESFIKGALTHESVMVVDPCREQDGNDIEVLRQCAKRSSIELAIQEEEKSKRTHHANA